MINKNKVAFENWFNFEYLLEMTTVSMKRSKRNFLFEFISEIEVVSLF